MSSISKINKICKSVLALTDEDFKEVEAMQKEQSDFSHPLKNATAAKYNEIGDYNKRVIGTLRILRTIIQSGERAVNKKASKI